MKTQLFYILIISLCAPLTNIYCQDERLQAMINNINVINSLASKNITLAGDLDIAQPLQSGNLYQIRNLIDAKNNNNWNFAAAGNCPATTCRMGRSGCPPCFVKARCSFDQADNTLICSRLMPDFNYTNPAGWILQPNQNYRLIDGANGNPVLYDANGARVTPLDQAIIRERQRREEQSRQQQQLANLQQQLANTPEENFGERIRLHLQILRLQQQTDPASFASNFISTLNTIQTLIPDPIPQQWRDFATLTNINKLYADVLEQLQDYIEWLVLRGSSMGIGTAAWARKIHIAGLTHKTS